MGGSRFQPAPVSQLRTYCLSNEGWSRPTRYSEAGQKREESGVSASSISAISPSSQPNSNFVSAMITPRSRATPAA